jgi:ABC-2 type transport system permease protein
MLAGEEEAGSLDLLLVTPLSTTRLLLQKAMALVISTTILGLAVLAATVVGSQAFGLHISLRAATVGATAMVLLGIKFGLLALVTGALTGRRGTAIAVPAGLVMACYLLFVAGVFVDELSRWRGSPPSTRR